MSVKELSPCKSSSTSFSSGFIPQISLFSSKRMASEFDIPSPEVSTPLLPNQRKGYPKSCLMIRRRILAQEFAQGIEEPTSLCIPREDDDNESQGLSVPSEPQSPLSPDFQVSRCPNGEEINFNFMAKMKELTRKQEEETRQNFGEDFYQRIDDFLDGENLHICLPEAPRKSLFNSLRVSTVRMMSNGVSDTTSGATATGTVRSEMASPCLISPSIHTSKLFLRRSSSKDLSLESAPSGKKLGLAKSPFYNMNKRGLDVERKESSGQEENEEPVIEAGPKRFLGLASLNTKLREFGERSGQDHSEASSATSIVLLDCSPIKI